MKKILFAFVILLGSCAAFADMEQLYEDIMAYYQGITTFQAELLQENYWQEINISKTSRGMIYYNRDSLHIAYLKPDEQQLFVLQNDILIYEPATAQAIWMDKGDFKIKPEEILSFYWESSEIEIISQSGNETILLLTNPAESIEIVLDKLFIRSVQITDGEGNIVKYSFQAEHINLQLPSGIFTLQLPPKTNVIDNRNGGN
ncbi:MAG: outer membrane lipoprotein carrier protein LolA [Candidatus Cloacimonetes bacterium]|nr:outer membrane lipoprotein carrier protein LolA [Candidatus Cloacimonadota bacterium]